MGRNKKVLIDELWRATNDLILEVGYEGFTMSLIANKMDVSRAAIYRLFPTKEELIIEFMLLKMDYTITLFNGIDHSKAFNVQLDDLLQRMLKIKGLHEILGLAIKIADVSPIVKEKKEALNSMHTGLYGPLLKVVHQGKEELLIPKDKDDFLILSFIFQMINIPNHRKLDENIFLNEIKSLFLFGVSK